jgi:hypothetical protein
MGLLDRIRRWASSHARPPFERTTCACDQCVSFCKTKPGALIPSDLDRIAHRLVDLGRIERPADVGRFLRATRGSEIIDVTTQRTTRIPQIGPARDRRGRCTFLSAEDRCEIHGVSPFGCAYFDAHLPKPEIDRRKLWGLAQMRTSRQYLDLRETLELAEGGKNEKY